MDLKIVFFRITLEKLKSSGRSSFLFLMVIRKSFCSLVAPSPNWKACRLSFTFGKAARAIISTLSNTGAGTGASGDEITRLVEDRVDARFRDAVGTLKLEDLLGEAREAHRRSAANYMI